jgi:hypothetical protein
MMERARLTVNLGPYLPHLLLRRAADAVDLTAVKTAIA